MTKYLFFTVVLFVSKFSFAQTTYTFIGNGNWSDSNNWMNKMMPPSILDNGSKISISPLNNGVCNVDTIQFIIAGSSLIIEAGKKVNLLNSRNIASGVKPLSSKVILPEQAALNMNDVSVYSFLHKVKPDQNGDFKVMVQSGRSEDVLLVTNKDNNVMFLKYLTDTSTDLSVSSESTAMALLLFYPLLQPVSPEQKKELIQMYKSQQEFNELVAEVGLLCKEGKNIFDSTNENLISLINTLVGKDFNNVRHKPTRGNTILDDKGPVSITSSDNGTVLFANSAIVSYTAQIYRIKDNTPVGTSFNIAGTGLQKNPLLSLIITILRDFDTDETAAERSIDLRKAGQIPGEYGIKITSGDFDLGNEPLNIEAAKENIFEMLSAVLGNLLPGPTDLIKNPCFKTVVTTVINSANFLNIMKAVPQGNIWKEYIAPIILDIAAELPSTTSYCKKDINQNKLISKLIEYGKLIVKFIPVVEYGSSWAINRKTITACQFLDEDFNTSNCFFVKASPVQENIRVCKTIPLRITTLQNEIYYPYESNFIANRNIKWYALNGTFPSESSGIVPAKTDQFGEAIIDWQVPSIEMDAKVKVSAQINALDFTSDAFITKTTKYNYSVKDFGGAQVGEINKKLPFEIKFLVYDKDDNFIPNALSSENYNVSYDIKGGGSLLLKSEVNDPLVINEWTLGSQEGVQTVNVTIYSKPCDGLSQPQQILSISFEATAFNSAKPFVVTSSVDVSTLAVTSGGNVLSDGGSPITTRGVCWSNNQNPTISDNVVSSGSGTGMFGCTITDFVSNNNYFLRAYATNASGTWYGDQKNFKTDTSTYFANYFVPGTIVNNSMTLKLHFENGSVTGKALIGGYPLWSKVYGSITGTQMTLNIDYDNEVIPSCTFIPQPPSCPACKLNRFPGGSYSIREKWVVTGEIDNNHTIYNATYIRNTFTTQIVGNADCSFGTLNSEGTENGNFRY